MVDGSNFGWGDFSTFQGTVHGPTLLRAIEAAEKRNEPIMVTRRQNLGERSVNAWYDYNIRKEVFEYKVPSALIAKVLKPGERVK